MSKTQFNTRRLNASDAALAQNLVQQFHKREISLGYMQKFLANPTNFLLVAEANGELVGFLLAHELGSLEHEATAMFIYEIEVTESYQRRGIGTALVKHIRHLAEAQGAFEMYVFTNHLNESAVAFYHSTGGQIEAGDELMFVYPLLTPTATSANTSPE